MVNTIVDEKKIHSWDHGVMPKSCLGHGQGIQDCCFAEPDVGHGLEQDIVPPIALSRHVSTVVMHEVNSCDTVDNSSDVLINSREYVHRILLHGK